MAESGQPRPAAFGQLLPVATACFESILLKKSAVVYASEK
jgi:hypothetical protein